MMNTPKCYLISEKAGWKGDAEYSNSYSCEKQLEDSIHLFLILDLFLKEEEFGKVPQTFYSDLSYNAKSTTHRRNSHFCLKMVIIKSFSELKAVFYKLFLRSLSSK